jgi:transcriptional regulator with XRE-family HTH domain
MTRAELAERLGTKPSVISRLESSAYGKVSISALTKIAGAMNCGLGIEFLPRKVSDVSESSEERPHGLLAEPADLGNMLILK